MTKTFYDMAKVSFIVILFLLLIVAGSINGKAENDNGTLPEQSTVPMDSECQHQPDKCYGRVYSIYVGDRTYQAVAYTLYLHPLEKQTVRIEINDTVYTSEFQQGGFVIEADSVETVYFKILNSDGLMIYLADWTKEERHETCFGFEYNVNFGDVIERYGVVKPGHSVIVGNRTYDIRNQTFIFATLKETDNLEYVRETVSGKVIQCYGGWVTLERFPYAMDYTLSLPMVNK